ncbi:MULTISPECIES: TldD/PmbA family protein [unclassified Butyrivibrio]|uniref:TldD/PmbA family protein n=1 Tax=unclassified Butyrivibrio TaxID=2639466 RepID=UPI0003FB60D7|nr:MULTISPECIES: TldD/PmbA family protein [unclassified Butyrivibrio]SEL30846.1 TldD protein [Butyrivibrio sp. ob235]
MLKDIYESNKALFEDGVQTVLRAQENRYRSVNILKGNMVSNHRRESRGISARVGKDGLFGFASIAECSDEAAKKVLKAASENVKLLARHAGSTGIVLPPSYGTGLIPTNDDIVDAEQKRIIEVCRQLDDYIAQKYPNLESRSIYYSEDSQDRIIYSSDAYDGHLVTPRCYIYVSMGLKTKDGNPVDMFKALGGYGSFEDNFSDIEQYYPEIEKLYKKVKDKADGVYAEAGYKTVVLGGMMGGMLAHEAVGHTVEADLVMGGSVAGPSLGKRVASDLVNLVDFAHTFNGEVAPLPVYLDDEGIKAEDAVLIKDGILTGYMNSRETAEKYNMKPTGNVRGWSFADEPLIRMRNTCILPGENTVEELIESVEDGYYLIDSGNGQADLTGEFMFGVTCGYEIKNGKLGRALLDTTVSGVAFEMLKTVDMVSNEVEWSSSGFCGKKQQMAVGMGGPHMRCKIMIGGR